MRWVASYFAALATICVLDFLWLGFVARDFFRGQIGALLLERPRRGDTQGMDGDRRGRRRCVGHRGDRPRVARRLRGAALDLVGRRAYWP